MISTVHFMSTYGSPRPFVKWAGGKSQAYPQFRRRGLIPHKYNNYFEPFLGGGAIFLQLRPEAAILSDNNEELINGYQVIKSNIRDLVKILKKYKAKHSKEFYYKIRGQDVKTLDRVERAGRMIYLNKTCFNGLYRVNSKGQFNVPMGQYKNPNILGEKNLLKMHSLLNKPTIKIMVADFEDIEDACGKNDFIYLDPPYHPLSKTANFTAYTKKTFGEEEQKRLAAFFRRLSEKGCKVLLSNSGTEFIRNLYKKFYIHENIMVPRYINSDATKRKPISEIAITNYPAEKQGFKTA